MNILLITVILMGGVFGAELPTQKHTIDDMPIEQLYAPVPVTNPYCAEPCTMSQTGYQLVMFFEGFSPVRYICAAGYPTIGFGHVILPDEKFPLVITGMQAEELLKKDMRRFEKAVNKYIAVELGQHQFDAITSFTFNLGEGALAKSTLLKKVNAQDHESVPEQLKRWVYAAGKKLRGLLLRREAEARLYATGEW